MEELKLERKGRNITWVGLFTNIFLFIYKLIAGLVGRSQAILADAFHTLSDLSTDIIVLFGLKISLKEEDESHPYGHGKAETISAFTLGLFLVIAGLFIFFESISKSVSIYKGSSIQPPTFLALSGGLISIFSKEILYRYTISIGKKLGSSAIIANAWHHRSDSLSSVASSLGVGGAILLGKKWIILDPLAGGLVSFFIIKVCYNILKKEIGGLMEASPEKEIKASVEKILKNDPNVKEFHKLRMRYIGRKLALDFHLVLDENLSFSEAHSIATSIENKIKEKVSSIHTIVIHMEPVKEESNFVKIEDEVKNVINGFEEILSFHRFHIFPGQKGATLALDIVLPSNFSLERGHEIAKELRKRLLEIEKIKDAIIHIDIEGKEEE